MTAVERYCAVVLRAASLGVAVATGEPLVRPATWEQVVGGADIAHRSVREHDVNAPALPTGTIAGVRVGCLPDLYAALAGEPPDHVITL